MNFSRLVFKLLSSRGVCSLSKATRSLTLLLILFAASLVFLSPAYASMISPEAITSTTSTAFAGYVISPTTANTITEVQGNWTVPTISCAATPTGINSIYYIVSIQGNGGGIDIGCSDGRAFYAPFCEFVSLEGCTGISDGDTVSPGDKMGTTVTVTYSTHSVNLLLEDVTKPWGYIHTSRDTGTLLNAYWVIEGGPVDCGCGLPNFGTFKTSKNLATIAGKHGAIGSFASSATVFRYTLVDTAAITLARPSSLFNSGRAFTVTWVAAT